MFIRRALALVVAVLWLWPTGLFAQTPAYEAVQTRGYMGCHLTFGEGS